MRWLTHQTWSVRRGELCQWIGVRRRHDGGWITTRTFPAAALAQPIAKAPQAHTFAGPRPLYTAWQYQRLSDTRTVGDNPGCAAGRGAAKLWRGRPQTLTDLVAPGWGGAFAPVEGTGAEKGGFLRGEIAAGRAPLPAGGD